MSDTGKTIALIKAVAGGIDPSAIEQSVSDWLDDHPEATTTVEDGSITKAKLDNNLQETVDDVSDLKNEVSDYDTVKNYTLIKSDSEKTYGHNSSPSSVTVYPNAYTQDIPIRYTSGVNLFEGVVQSSGTQGGITRTADGRFVKVAGEGTGGFNLMQITDEASLSKLAGKTVNIYLYIKKATGWGNSSYLAVRENDSTDLARINFSTTGNTAENLLGWTAIENITFSQTLTKVRIYFNSLNGTTFADGDYYWMTAFQTSAIITETLATTDPVSLSVSSGMTGIDTMMHESVITEIVPTKTYVDNHIPDIKALWTEEIYALPEHFGAVGDGVADDATALADCIAYAVSNGKAVRGYGKYKTSSPVVLNGRYLDVYLREINYTGNDTAVNMQQSDMVFNFHRIQSSAIGITLGKHATANAYARRCQIKGDEISSTGNCIELKDYTLYDSFEIRYLNTTNGNCINWTKVADDAFATEFVFRDSSCACPNGYVVSNVFDSKFYNFTVEGNCKYGLLNPQGCVCVGWRHREQIDGTRLRVFGGDQTRTNGALFVFTNTTGLYGFRYITADTIPYYAIDTSAIQGYESVQVGDSWRKMCFNALPVGVGIRGVERTSCEILGNDFYIIGGNPVFVPKFRRTVNIDIAECDFTLLESNTDEDIYDARDICEYMGTDILLDVAHTDIYFNASFGAVGYNDLTLTQENGNTATIYDKLGNVLFDGTNEGDGKWSLKCIMDRSSYGRWSGTGTTWWCYDGTNEQWEITKLS